MSLIKTTAAAALMVLGAASTVAASSTYNAGSGSFAPAPTAGSGGFAAPTQVVGIPGNGLAGLGGRLTDARGVTLYSYAADVGGQSACYGACASQWPPYLVGSAPSAIPGASAIVRQDGQRQWTFNGQPLYFYVGDQAPGQASGDGASGTWRAIAVQTN